MMDTNGEETVKIYQYKNRKLLSSYGAAVLLTIVFLVSIFQLWKTPDNKILQKMVIFIPLLLLIEFFTLNEPTKITDDGEYITFYAFGRKHAYKWTEMNQLKIKRFAMSDRVLVQIGNKWLYGRYWLTKSSISNGSELLDKLISHENKLKKKK